jgi:hypothetical protein
MIWQPMTEEELSLQIEGTFPQGHLDCHGAKTPRNDDGFDPGVF